MDNIDKYCLVKAECDEETTNRLNKLLGDMNIGITLRHHFHCTLLYARTYKNMPTLRRYTVEYKIKEVVKMSDGKAVAAILDLSSNSGENFSVRNTELLAETEGVEDYSYLAHVTLGYQESELTKHQNSLLAKLVGETLCFYREEAKTIE